jgi:hypothetical protein
VHEGLNRVFDVPLNETYLELGGSASIARGPAAWVEVGSHPLQHIGVFGRAFATPFDLGVEAGIRLTL